MPKNSWHIRGRAADFKVQLRDGWWKDISPVTVFSYLDSVYTGNVGIGLYSGWVHLDSRTGQKALWGEV